MHYKLIYDITQTAPAWFFPAFGLIPLKTAVERREYQVVEGRVENFRPMPRDGHSLESFTVNGKEFEYSDFVVTPGFRNTQSYGGPIHEGLFVRIGYIENQTTRPTRDIVRLEVKE